MFKPPAKCTAEPSIAEEGLHGSVCQELLAGKYAKA